MSRTLNGLNNTGLAILKVTDTLVGTEDGSIRGWIPTAATALVAGLKGHKVHTGPAKKAKSNWDKRIDAYIKAHPDC